ncbi:MAG: ribose-phosphate diphosphokinase [Bauldia sp.]
MLYPLFAGERLALRVAERCGAALGRIETRRFPDGETYLRYADDPAGRDVVILAQLDRPDPKLFPLALALATARELGARRVGLVAPYLPYLRQDKRFHPGEAVSAAHALRFLAGGADWLVTVDPHLHRIKDLADVAAIPATVAHAAPALAAWIAADVRDPLLIGPDSESAQWVEEVARDAGAPYRVLRKRRLGDRSVTLRLPSLRGLTGRTPVLVDDIVSSGATMLAAAARLADLGMAAPVVVAVHALFARGAYAALSRVARAVVTANTVRHRSNRIDVAPALAAAVNAHLAGDA